MPAKKTTEQQPTRRRVQIDLSQGGRTHQSFKDECDINRIMARHKKTGIIRQTTERPQYGDFSNLPDYQEAMNTVIQADSMFAELNSEVRERFQNNPQKFLDFCDDPENQDEAIRLGIAAKPEPAQVETDPAVEGENPIIGGE